MQSPVPSEPDLSFLDERHRSVLNIITECSPCTEPKLFISAINAKLDCFSDRSLSELRDLLDQCIQELKASGLIEVVDSGFVVATAAGAEDEEGLNAELAEIGEDAANEALWSQMERTYADLENEPETASEVSKRYDDAVLAASDDDPEILDLTDDLELLELEDVLVEDGDVDDADKEPDDEGQFESEGPTSVEQQSAQANDEESETVPSDVAEELAQDVAGKELAGKDAVNGDEDIFDLSDALELTEVEDETFDRPSVEDEPPAGPQPADNAQQAEEPSREEIIDAMRRFMADNGSEKN